MNYMTRDQLREKCPAAFNTEPLKDLSDKYTPLSTLNIIDKFEEFDYFPTLAKNSRSRNGVDIYNAHTIRFRHKNYLDLNWNDLAPELVFLNSHNGRISAKIMAGMFRPVCSNGLVITSSNFGFVSHKHIGITSNDLEEVIYNFAKSTDKILSNVDKYKKVELKEDEKRGFARVVKNAVFGRDSKIEYDKLLNPKREADAKNDLFTVYNVVQENIIKGGIEYQGPKRKTKTKGINSVSRDLEVNTFLWNTMEEFYLSR